MANINHIANSTQQQRILLEEEDGSRSLLDQLLTDSRLYTTGKEYQELLDFVAKLPNFAPFNAMLLQIQKLGLRFAASAYDWNRIFRRTIKAKPRPRLLQFPGISFFTVHRNFTTSSSGLRVLGSGVASGAA